MAKHRYTVRVDGVELGSRRSHRIYSHAVIAMRNIEAELRTAQATARFDTQASHPFYVREADPATRQHTHTDEALARIQRYGAMSPAEYLEWREGELRAAIERQEQAGAYARPYVASFHSSARAAETAAAALRRKGLLDVRVVPVSIEP